MTTLVKLVRLLNAILPIAVTGRP